MTDYQSGRSSATGRAFKAFERLVEADTECTVAGLEMSERVNLNTANKYMNYNDAATGLDIDAEYLKKTHNSIRRYCKQVDDIVLHIDQLEKITQQVDEWSKELDVKSRRIK
ncbi:hypothetical protein TRICI_004128 [Trichomonascus ciferrii]|uniref:Uncharacterized protein n=1 Tax=Trichomonascus ciferrii TaxID=44093 RepID=A0A642V1S6_9ASCO|nr:hypothetical protein TRICI_004128 [Trichomonascus ciferrii]